MYEWINRAFFRVTIAKQLIIAASALVSCAVIVMGLLATNWMENAITTNAANISASYMERFVTPNVQQLSVTDSLSLEQKQALNRAIQNDINRDNVVYLQIWNTSGTIVYSTMESMVGRTYPPSSNFRRAMNGSISAEFDNPPHVDDLGDDQPKEHLLEIYWPLREIGTGRIIAIAEFYVKGEAIYNNLGQLRSYSWLLRLIAVIIILIAIYFFITHASRIINSQQRLLQDRIIELQDSLQQNEALRNSLREISINVSEVSEHILQRFGADLHDGPAQTLTYLLLRFDRCVDQLRAHADPSGLKDLNNMRTMLLDTLREIRSLSEGLSLPGLSELSLEETVRLAVDRHIHTTSTTVSVDIRELPDTRDHNLKACIYRLVQEGLTNAFHHAGAVGQSVYAEYGERIKIVISDQGPGFTLDRVQGRLGLFGLRARVEACGGRFELVSGPGKGVTLAASFEAR